jgi:FkbM family methyltransferase
MRLAGLLTPEYVLRPTQLFRRARSMLAPCGTWAYAVLPWGAVIGGIRGDAMFDAIERRGVADIEVTESLFRLLSARGVFVDAGANIGSMSFAAAEAGAARILMFEPHPAVYQVLGRNLLALRERYPSIAIESFAIALSDSEREADLLEPSDFSANRGRSRLTTEGLTSGFQRIPVQVRRLDAMFGDRIDVLKVDVERHEYELFIGAAALLEKQVISHIIFEEHHEFPSAAHQELQRHGYTIMRLGRKLRGPVLIEPRPGSGGPNTNYIATAHSIESVQRSFAAAGWRCLKALPSS